jgi:hypothetical protein
LSNAYYFNPDLFRSLFCLSVVPGAIFSFRLSTKPGYLAISIETDNTDASVNVTKPEETTTKVMEKHMDNIKSVIQDTMKTVHENIDKVQSNVVYSVH